MPVSPTPAPAVLTAFRCASALVCCGAIGLLAGCASGPESHVVSAPPPAPTSRAPTSTTTTTTPNVVAPGRGYAATGSQVVSTTVVTQTPPAPQPEVVLARPTPHHNWLAGYWTWRNDRYEWVAGHWELPPYTGAQWVMPRWEPQGSAYVFTEGYWY